MVSRALEWVAFVHRSEPRSTSGGGYAGGDLAHSQGMRTLRASDPVMKDGTI